MSVASAIGVIVAVIMYSLKGLMGKMMKKIGLYQTFSFTKTLYSSILGAYSHIFLDSFLYPEMNPFYPLLGNPLVGIANGIHKVYNSLWPCGFLFLIGLILYFKKRTSSTAHGSKRTVNSL